MSDQTRELLNVPKSIRSANGKLIHVRKLAAREVVMLVDSVIVIGVQLRKDIAEGVDALAAIRFAMFKEPDAVLNLISPAVSCPDEPEFKLADEDIELYLEVLDAFLELHDEAIKRFFLLRDRWEKITAAAAPKVTNSKSGSSSTPSSRRAGDTLRSLVSPSSSSNSSADSPPPEGSENELKT